MLSLGYGQENHYYQVGRVRGVCIVDNGKGHQIMQDPGPQLNRVRIFLLPFPVATANAGAVTKAVHAATAACTVTAWAGFTAEDPAADTTAATGIALTLRLAS